MTEDALQAADSDETNVTPEAQVPSTGTLSPPEPSEPPSPGTDSAPETEETAEKVVFDERQQAVLDAQIGKKTYLAHEERRKREAVERENADLRAKLEPQAPPEPPAAPDRFEFDSDDQWHQAMAQRDKAVAEAARFRAKNEFAQEQQTQQRQQFEAQQQRELYEDGAKYAQRAVALGINPQELQQAANNIAAFGIDPIIERELLKEENGPLLTLQIGSPSNIAHLEQLSRMNQVQAGRYIETQIKPKAAARKQNTSSAPEPLDSLKGGGVPPKERGPQGATFE